MTAARVVFAILVFPLACFAQSYKAEQISDHSSALDNGGAGMRRRSELCRYEAPTEKSGRDRFLPLISTVSSLEFCADCRRSHVQSTDAHTRRISMVWPLSHRDDCVPEHSKS